MALRRRVVLVSLIVIAGGAWLAFGKDATREKVIHSLADLGGRAVAPKTKEANWGDVAKKIGDFAAEERGLRDSVNRAEAAQSTPAH
jgi:hypothetical protein